MLLASVLASLTPASALVVSGRTAGVMPTRQRARPVVALAEMPDLVSGLTSTLLAARELPPEFAEFARPHDVQHKWTFSRYLVTCAAAYTVGFGGSSLFHMVRAKLRPDEEAIPVNANLLRAKLTCAPVSKFGWLQRDVRLPLPKSYAELYEAPIGARDGKTVFLCTADAALKYEAHEVELSKEFTEHYGESVFICYA